MYDDILGYIQFDKEVRETNYYYLYSKPIKSIGLMYNAEWDRLFVKVYVEDKQHQTAIERLLFLKVLRYSIHYFTIKILIRTLDDFNRTLTVLTTYFNCKCKIHGKKTIVDFFNERI